MAGLPFDWIGVHCPPHKKNAYILEVLTVTSETRFGKNVIERETF